MKAAILKILQLQEEGKLTKEQAAELLTVLADQARERDGAATGAQSAPSEGAPGPRGDSGCWGAIPKSSSFNATAALHDMVDAAVGVGATVGRAATVLGGELANMVHRQEAGNAVTLSKVEAPAGEAFTFRGNTFNVSKVSHLDFNQAQFTGNVVNASKMAHLSITNGRFVQCTLAGSSVSHVTIEGLATEALAAGGDAPAEGAAAAGEGVPATGMQAVTFNGSKFARVTLAAGSVLEATAFQAAAVKEWTLADGSSIRDSKFNDSNLGGLSMERAHFQAVTVERSHVQTLTARDVTLENTLISGARGFDVTLAGGAWKDVRICRQMGGNENVLEETRFENCALTGCEFAGCTFRRTTLRGVNLSGITVRNVDFTGRVMESAEAFRQAAGI
jgi:uncharacterized protein YjbI with pentapeptide repeats